MQANEVSFLLQQMLGHLPLLAVSICGIVMAMMNWQRSRTPAMLVLIGASILLLQTIAQPLAYATLEAARRNDALPFPVFINLMRALGLLTSFAHAAAILLFILAAFLHRGDSKRLPQPPAYR